MAVRYVGKPVLTVADLREHRLSLPAAARSLLGSLIEEMDAGAPPAAIRASGDWYLDSIEVSGHAGVGATPVRLGLVPAPSLTIVTASNGVGKTSIAHAVRRVLTDGTAPAAGVVADHVGPGASRCIRVGLVSGARTITLTADDEAGSRWLEGEGPPGRTPTWWTSAFQRHLPVLLYPEVAKAIEDPKSLHDALESALDLTVLRSVQERLEQIRKAGRDAARTVADARAAVPQPAYWPELRQMIDVELPTPATVERIRTLLREDPVEHRSRPAIPELAPLDPVPALEALQAARSADGEVVAGSRVLHQALRALISPDHPVLADCRDTDTCPVCQTTGAGWVAAAARRTDELGMLVSASEAARREAGEALARLRNAVPPAPAREPDHGLDGWVDFWTQWSGAQAAARRLSVDHSSDEDVLDLTTRVKVLHGLREDIVRRLDVDDRLAAQQRAEERLRVESWLVTVEKHRQALAEHAAADDLNRWVSAQIKGTRDTLFQPIAGAATRLWQRLNPDGDLAVGDFRIEGGARYRAKIRAGVWAGKVPVEKDEFGVLSTGQRNALTLAMFLPRATSPGSPFRFLLLDDPVQAFDGARVRLLARELAELAGQFQVIVLTHDERLWIEARAIAPYARRIHLERVAEPSLVVEAKEATSTGRLMLSELAATLAAHGRGVPLQDAAVTALTLACCRQALDAEVTVQVLALGSRAGRGIEELRKDLADNSTTRARLDLLDRCLKDAGAQPVDRAAHAGTVDALNQGSHGQAPPVATAAMRLHWHSETTQLVERVLEASAAVCTDR